MPVLRVPRSLLLGSVCAQTGGLVPFSCVGRVAAALAGARRHVASHLPALALADGASMADFEIGRRLGARARPVPGNRYYGVNSAVFECIHVASRAVVAVKLLFAIANEPGAEAESHALRDRCVIMPQCIW